MRRGLKDHIKIEHWIPRSLLRKNLFPALCTKHISNSLCQTFELLMLQSSVRFGKEKI